MATQQIRTAIRQSCYSVEAAVVGQSVLQLEKLTLVRDEVIDKIDDRDLALEEVVQDAIVLLFRFVFGGSIVRLFYWVLS